MKYRILAILSLIAMTVAYSIYQQKSMESQLVPSSKGEAILARLPEASFTTLEEKPYSLEELYATGEVKLLIVHFWGTWCAPCEAELPELLQLIKRFEGQPGVKFLLVAVNDELVKVKKHVKGLPPYSSSITWLIDNQNVFREKFGTTRVPETYVFSSDKTTLRKYVGPQEWNKTMFFQSFDEFLQISSHKL